MIFQQFEHITKENFPLSSVSSMKTGGCARYALFPEKEDELIGALRILRRENMKYHLVGNASNLLFPDECGDAVYIFTSKLSELKKLSDTEIYASAGVLLSSLSLFARKNSLSGLEFAFGIPGSCGGGIFMNAGAYGGELSQVLTKVFAYDAENGEKLVFENSDCGFSYRSTVFMKNKNLAVLGGIFRLVPGDEKEIEKVCREQLKSRREKQPLEYPSCGSAFKRPEGHFAGKLIEDAGLKGLTVGGAQVSEKHAGFIINVGGATSDDVKKLICEVKKRVYESTGIMLEPEIEILE